MDLRRVALKYALINAVSHEGRAEFKAVLNKIFVDVPEVKEAIRSKEKREEIFGIVEDSVRYVNSMSYDDQVRMLEREFGITLQMLEEKKAMKTRIGLPELPNAVKGKVVTRFAPAPTGAIHLGQVLRAAYLSWYYARKYDGKFILRIEDTDPRRVKRVYYDWIQEDLRSLGLEWDEIVYESDHFDEYYELTYRLFEEGKVYVCNCKSDEFKRFIARKVPCPHRDKQGAVDYWEDMISGKYREGEAVVRLKTDLTADNPALRDPPLLRIIESVPHPRTGYKYRVYPLYNYACIIEDHNLGITHVIRAKEHETNQRIQRMIADAFGWSIDITYVEYGMIKITGVPAHKRDIRSALRRKEMEGWDDPRLITIRALLQRGIHPEAIKMLAEHVGMTKHDIEDLSLKTLFTYNARVLSPMAKRIFFVEDPLLLKISVSGDVYTSRNPWIPGNEEMGYREYRLCPVRENGGRILRVYISKSDLELIRKVSEADSILRLKGLMNIKIKNIDLMGGEILAEEAGINEVKGVDKIHWVPAGDLSLKAFVITPEGTKEGVVEFYAQLLSNGEYVQMERYGWGRVYRNEGEVIYLMYAHK